MKKKLLLTTGAIIAISLSIAGMSAFEAHVINVTAQIENALSVLPDRIEFGTVFPEELLIEQITIGMSQSFIDEDRVDNISYAIKQKPKPRPDAIFPDRLAGHEWCLINEPADAGDPNDPYYELCYPVLCPFLSKHDADPEDENDGPNIEPFHQSGATTYGYLSKLAEDIYDLWDIDLLAPCFRGQCAQDGVVPAEYQLDPRLESQEFGCDLWIEVDGINDNINGRGRSFFTEPVSERIGISFDSGASYVVDELIIGFYESATIKDINNLISSFNGIIVGTIQSTNEYQVQFPWVASETELNELLDYIILSDLVEYAAKSEFLNSNQLYPAGNNLAWDDWDIDNPGGNNWAHEHINLPEAWEISDGSRSPNIGVIDTGFDYAHIDLAKVIQPQGNGNGTPPLQIHGTEVVGLIGASWNDFGINGAAREAKVYAAAVTTLNDFGVRFWVDKLISDYGVKIINFSGGGESSILTYANARKLLWKRTINNNSDVLFIFSAGQENADKDDYQSWPSGLNMQYDNVISVANSGQNLSDGSSFIVCDSNYHNTSIAAPGLSFITTKPGNNYGLINCGTSYSAPMVTGVAALVWSANPGLTAEEVKNIIIKGSKAGGKIVKDENGTELASVHVIDAKEAVCLAINYQNSVCQKQAYCGNGIVEEGEECDDGNMINGDGCSAQCLIEAAECAPGSPPLELLVFKNGYYWVWASPCSGGCSTVEPIKISGWRFATEEEWQKRPDVVDFGISDNFKCASSYFDYTYVHCDYFDAERGYVTSQPNGGPYETWLIYDCS